jgi:hypothetical protein
MGCPYEAKFLFGIRLTEEQEESLNERMDSDESLSDDDYIEVDSAYSGGDEPFYYLDLSNSYNTVSCCSVIGRVNYLDTMKEKALKKFNSSALLKEMFSESDIQPLLICTYCG